MDKPLYRYNQIYKEIEEVVYNEHRDELCGKKKTKKNRIFLPESKTLNLGGIEPSSFGNSNYQHLDN